MSPRYLAGHQVDDHVGAFCAPLDEHGWTVRSDDHVSFVYSSPCLRIQVGWILEIPDEAPIQIVASAYPLGPPLWRIAMDSDVPTEFVTTLIEALPRTLAEDPAALFASETNWDADLPLPLGWRPLANAPGSHVASPDNLASYDADPPRSGKPMPYTPGWTFGAGEPTGREGWTAHFSATVPRLLVEVFHQVVTDPTPLIRDHRDISPWVRPYLATRPAWSHSLPSRPRAESPRPPPLASRVSAAAPPAPRIRTR
ncbi:DUF317 domain-containing protein [Streptomyces sp. NPDC051561]|uniref:DUF317 domain-containing protein n=1 Tax=Streptomyces sp. NPDC051561 TaxID=3365658 RepID=UPI00378DCF38